MSTHVAKTGSVLAVNRGIYQNRRFTAIYRKRKITGLPVKPVINRLKLPVNTGKPEKRNQRLTAIYRKTRRLTAVYRKNRRLTVVYRRKSPVNRGLPGKNAG